MGSILLAAALESGGVPAYSAPVTCADAGLEAGREGLLLRCLDKCNTENNGVEGDRDDRGNEVKEEELSIRAVGKTNEGD